MSLQTTRLTVTVAVALVVAVGLFTGPAAAGDGDGLLSGDDGGNEVSVGGGSSQASGSGTVDCDADQSGAHDCEKEGTLEAGPLTVDYEGNNGADPANQEGSFGDSLQVEANDQTAGGEIYCEFSADSTENPCAFNQTAPGGGGAPTLPPEDPPISPPEDPGLPIPPEDPGLPSPPEDPPISPPEDPGLPELPSVPGPELPFGILA